MWFTFRFSVKVLEKFRKSVLSAEPSFFCVTTRKKSFFLRNGRCEFAHFFGTFLKCVLSAEPRRTSLEGACGFWWRAFRKCLEKTLQSPVLRGDAFHELRRGPESSTAAREPSARASCFGLPRSSCPGLPRSSKNASFCGRKRFWINGWALSQLKKCQNLGPLAAHQDIYIYI